MTKIAAEFPGIQLNMTMFSRGMVSSLYLFFIFIYLFFIFIYLFMAVLGLSCGTQDPFIVTCRFFVVERRLSGPRASGILVPWPGIEPMFPALEGRFLTTGPPGKSPCISFLSTRKVFQEASGWSPLSPQWPELGHHTHMLNPTIAQGVELLQWA